MSREFEELMSQLEACESGNCNCGMNCRCEDVWEQIFALLDHEVCQEVAHRLLRHGANCPSCSARIEEELQMRKIIKRGCEAQAPAELRDRIEKMVGVAL